MGAKVARGSHWNRLFRSRHICLAATGANRWSDRRGRASHPTRATATRWRVRQRRRTSTSEGAYQTPNLCLSNVSDAGLAHLKGLTNLSLILGGTQVTDAGLAHLKGLTKLKLLQLSGTQVTDAGLAHLKGLTKLRHLTLGGTQVTDAGLVHLKGLTNLSAPLPR